MPRDQVTFEPVTPRRYDAWRSHYLRYSEALGEHADDAIAATVWSWLLARTHGVEGVLAVGDEGELAGFVHFRPFPRTLDGNEACFIDDIWVTDSYRGTGVARALIDRVRALALERGWTHVRWVAEAKNVRARALYDRIAEDANLVTYRIAVSDGA
ncbi:MAG: GNAT family N-acetyltransferase [Candidatus Eremiobacteraeota bacterium]|nr:GNAT family N-acetyltransferase [Candidatus Eremiobacteraeota bacterium]